MTERLVRYQQSGDNHFLTFSCYHRLPYLGSPEARNLFEDALERIRFQSECSAGLPAGCSADVLVLVRARRSWIFDRTCC